MNSVCPICEEEFEKSRKRQKYCCKSCAGYATNKTKIDWPSVETVVFIVTQSNFSEAGRRLGVSDNAVRAYLERNGVDWRSL